MVVFLMSLFMGYIISVVMKTLGGSGGFFEGLTAQVYGDFLPAMTPVLRLESIDDMLAEIQIDEVDIGKLHVGQAAEVASDSIIGRTLQARVQSIAPTVTALGSSRVSLVDLAIAPTDAPLKSGASCSARITASIQADSLLIPLASFFSEEGLSFVYVLVPGGQKNSKGAEVFKLEKREIKTGASNVSFIEVVSGLGPDPGLVGRVHDEVATPIHGSLADSVEEHFEHGVDLAVKIPQRLARILRRWRAMGIGAGRGQRRPHPPAQLADQRLQRGG
jgi:hypothetical protein